MKQWVTKSCRYEPVFTDMLEQWANHNNIALLAARPYKPKDKASVENNVKITYRRIYAGLRNDTFMQGCVTIPSIVWPNLIKRSEQNSISITN
jgi:transposase